MKIKKSLLALFLSTAVFSAWGQTSQVRELICIVSPHIEKGRVEQLKAIRDDKTVSDFVSKVNINKILEIEPEENKESKKGWDKLSAREVSEIDDFAEEYIIKDNFIPGKTDYLGFIYLDVATGKNYVITTKDALIYSDTADIMILDAAQRKYVTYTNLKRIAINDELNIGILELQEKITNKQMPLYTKEVLDGDKVFSASYQNDSELRDSTNELHWTFRDAYVINNDSDLKSEYRTFEINSFYDELSYIFAPDKDSPFNYSLLGLSVKSDNYELTSAIYATEIYKKINKMLSEKKPDEADLSKNVEILIEGLKQSYGYGKINPLISKNAIYNFTTDKFKKIEKDAPYKSNVRYSFSNNPFEGYRKAISYQIWHKYNDTAKLKDLSGGTPEKIDDTHYKVAITDAYKNNTLITIWILEENNWRLDSLSLTPESKKYSVEKDEEKLFNKKDIKIFGVEENSKMLMTTQMGVNVPLISKTYEKDSKTEIENNVVTGAHFSIEMLESFNGWGGMGFSFDVIPSDEDVLRTISMDALARIPVTFEYFAFAPKIKGGLMWNILSDSYAWGAYYEAGIDFFINDDWGFGTTFKQQFVFPIVKSTCRYNIMGVSAYFILGTY